MKLLALLAALVCAAACTKRNDAVCCTTDEDCDAFGLPRRTGCSDGEACVGHLCVAADCTSDATCTSDQPVCDLGEKVCSACAVDNDCGRFDDSPHCDPATGGCRECVMDAHCPASAPVCENNACRTCKLDAECASQVCDIDAGACIAASEVVYASEDGPTDATCSQANPCSLGRALTVATATSTVRMLPGGFPGVIQVGGARISIVATGARLLGSASTPYPIRVTDGGDVTIRGLDVRPVAGSDVDCRSTNGGAALLALRDVTIVNFLGIRVGKTCTMRILESTLEGGAGQNVLLDDVGGTLEIDRSHMFRSVSPLPNLARQVKVRVTNSVFENESVSISNYDAAGEGSTFNVAFNTFVFTNGGGIACASSSSIDNHPRIANLDNNVVVTNGDYALYVTNTGPNPCQSVRGNVVFPQNILPAPSDNLVADPQLVDVAHGDFRLKPGSPAIDAAVSTVTMPSIDFDAVPRPQGVALDAGAFERKP